jgi:hypothetical protein
VALTSGAFTCAFGVPWLHHFDPPIGTGKGCRRCVAADKKLARAFAAAVARGDYDAGGYTPAERRARSSRK